MACQGKGPIIVISGQPGSGKSTYARRLANDLGLRYFTTGQAFRELAKRLGMNLMELNEAAERDPSIDLEIDRAALREAEKGCVVIDSHLAGWTLREVADVAIYVKASLPVRAQRLGTELEFVIMVIAVSCVKLLSAHNSTQHTSRKHKV